MGEKSVGEKYVCGESVGEKFEKSTMGGKYVGEKSVGR